MCRLNINEPVDYDSPMLPPNFEFPVYEAMVEEDEEIPDEIRWMLASLKDAQKLVQKGKAEGWGQLVQLPENKGKEGLVFSTHKPRVVNPTEGTFHSVRFINVPLEINAVLKDQYEEEEPDFVTPGGTYCNWIAVDIPSTIPLSWWRRMKKFLMRSDGC